MERREAVEEIIAFYAETGKLGASEETWLNRVIQAVREWLANIGLADNTTPWTDTDIRQLIAESHGALARSRDSLGGINIEEEVVLDETGEVFVIQKDAQQELLANKKRREACERLKACMK